MVSSTFKESNVLLKFSIQDNISQAEIDIHQIKQVVNNIAVNAKEAMQNTGVFKVICENIDIKDEDFPALSHRRL